MLSLVDRLEVMIPSASAMDVDLDGYFEPAALKMLRLQSKRFENPKARRLDGRRDYLAKPIHNSPTPGRSARQRHTLFKSIS